MVLLEINLETDQSLPEVEVIRVEGRIDALSASDFEEKIMPLADTEFSSFIMDFKSLVYISSAGLRGILKFAKNCKANSKKIVLCNLAPEVYEVFKISGFDLIIKVCDDLDAAQNEVK